MSKITKQVSYFLYIHDDLSNDPSWKKIGIGMTPYSVVRARQKYCSKSFKLNRLYFGYPTDIKNLETKFKQLNKTKTGSYINKISAQTEMFNMSENDIVNELDTIIKHHGYTVQNIDLQNGYFAKTSSDCILDIPPENKCKDYLEKELTKIKTSTGAFPPKTAFDIIFGKNE